jgi:hypothetical protein
VGRCTGCPKLKVEGEQIVMADGDDFAAMVEAELTALREVEEAKRKADAARRKAERERRDLADAEHEKRQQRLAKMREAEYVAGAAERERLLKLVREREQKRVEAKANPRAGTKPELVWGEEVARRASNS